MRIAFLTREYPPYTDWGGIASVYHGLSCGLVKGGHRVHVICQAVDRPGYSEVEGVQVHRVGTNPERYSASARINYSLQSWQKLGELIRKEGIQIVEATCWGAEAFLYSWSKPVPLVVRLDVAAADLLRTNTYSGLKQLTGLKILSILEELTIKKADRIMAISRSLYRQAVKEMKITPQKVDLVYPGVDTSIYRRVSSSARKTLGIDSDSPLVLFVGRLETRKGVDLLCQAIPEVMRTIPGARFILVGRDTATAPSGGSMVDYLNRQAECCGFAHNLILASHTSTEELVQVYSECDVFVLPSLNEGFAMTILEAMACGKPVVTTSTSDIELTPPGGIIVRPGDVAGLAAAISRLLSLSREEKELAAKQNRELTEAQFSIPIWVKRTVEVYEKTLREERHG